MCKGVNVQRCKCAKVYHLCKNILQYKYKIYMRKLFTDSYNSLFHFVFGIISYKFFIVMPLFLLYQFSETLYFYYLGFEDSNIIIDILEFYTGYFLYCILDRKSN